MMLILEKMSAFELDIVSLKEANVVLLECCRLPNRGLTIFRAENDRVRQFAVGAHVAVAASRLDCLPSMMPWAHAHGYMLMPFHGTVAKGDTQGEALGSREAAPASGQQSTRASQDDRVCGGIRSVLRSWSRCHRFAALI